MIWKQIPHYCPLTHWGRVTHICVGNLTIIASDNGLSPGRRQAIILTNDGILFIGTLGTNFSEIPIGIQTFSFKKMHLNMSSVKWHPFCLSLNGLRDSPHPHKGLFMWSNDVSSDVSLNRMPSKQLRGKWFWDVLMFVWNHCNANFTQIHQC